MDKLNRIIESYPPELKLLLVCCGSERWKEPDLLPLVDWDQFFAWIKRHRVSPAVYRFIKKNPGVLPEKVVNRVEYNQRVITQRTLLLTSELLKIGRLFEKSKIDWLAIKGPVLAFTLFGDAAGRDYRDIDILVSEDHIKNSLEILLHMGYKTINQKALSSLVKLNHNIELKNPETSSKIELHWRLFASQILSKDYSIKQISKRKVELQGHSVNVCSSSYHNRYVLLHSALHQWSELQWVVDCHRLSMDNDWDSDRLFYEKEQLTPVLKTWKRIDNLLFKKEFSNDSENQFMVESCLKAIANRRKTTFGKIAKTRYLVMLSENRNYRNELLSLRLKRVITNPANKKKL